MSEQDPPNQQSDMPSIPQAEVNVSNENCFGYLSNTVCAFNNHPPFDGLTKSDGDLKEPECVDDEVEAGEISSSPKSSYTAETFAVGECELDFEMEAHNTHTKDSESIILTTKIKKESVADDGECTDEGDNNEEFDEDLEEGELKDEIPLFGPLETNANSKANPSTKTVCRFYNRGSCFYGNTCRFLHVTATKTGNYSMFAPAPRVGFTDGYGDPALPIGGINHRSGVLPPAPPPRTGSEFPHGVPPPQAPSAQPPALESAWERALQDAKELVKKANKRKIEEPDFNEKRLNLSLVVNEKNEVPPYTLKKKKKGGKRREFYESHFTQPHDIYNDGYESRPHSREGNFPDNIDIRYEKEKEKLRRGRSRMDRERDKFPIDENKERFRDDPRLEIPTRSRVDDFFDPWRRSKSPNRNVRRTRSRSRGSYSSVSSYSYTTSRSSYSSRSSSTSPHPPHQKRTPSPSTVNPPFASPKISSNKFTTMKNKPPGGKKSSRSMSRTPPRPSARSRSRSFSRSISMDSVSSASSSCSSHFSEPGQQNSNASILRKQENPSSAAAVGEKPVPETTATSIPPVVPLSTVYLNYNPPHRGDIVCKVEKSKGDPPTPPKEPTIIDEERDPLEEQFLTPVPAEIPFRSLQHLLPTIDKAKEPLKGTPHKQQIKLTLLNKNKTPKLNNLPKELDVNRKPNDEPSKPVGIYPSVKGPLSPLVPPVTAKPAPVLVPKKSASSRRDELLKQLKAVEDAIARKRAKFG